MNDTLENILLGLVEGITEFLPISSTGHLLIAQHWLGSRSELFTVVIQVGAILGVVVVYWRRLLDLALRLGLPENKDYLVKLVGFLFVYVWLRATLPRFRYDQLMDLGWKRLIPLALYWLLLVAALQIGRQEQWNVGVVLAAAIGAGAIGWAGLGAALRPSPVVAHELERSTGARI